MRTVGIRELKNRLSEYLALVRRGEEILVTDRGVVVAELRKPGTLPEPHPYPRLLEKARNGGVRLGAPNRPDLYTPPRVPLPDGEAQRLLDAEREERV